MVRLRGYVKVFFLLYANHCLLSQTLTLFCYHMLLMISDKSLEKIAEEVEKYWYSYVKVSCSQIISKYLT